MLTVGGVYDFLDRAFPFSLAEKGDPVGLLAGERDWPVKRILLALDITRSVAEEAKRKSADLVISHHPVIYHPLAAVNGDNPACLLWRDHCAAICSHTCLDMAPGGVNDTLIRLLGLKKTGRLAEVIHSRPYHQLSVMVPPENAQKVREAAHLAGAGTWPGSRYTECSFSCEGVGRFRPSAEASPYLGTPEKLEETPEVRLEFLVPPDRKKLVERAVLEAHPYQEPAYAFVENHAMRQELGYGEVCALPKPMTAGEFAQQVKNALGCRAVRYVDGGKPLQTVTVCSGGGGSLLPLAMASGADGFLTGDTKHDQHITALNRGFTLLDAGHYHTERVILPVLKEMLEKAFPGIVAEAADSCSDPLEQG